MLIATIALATVVGLTLGLFGAGGAVLTVPILVYLLGVPVKSAVPMSLIVIGASSAIAASERWRTGLLDLRKGVVLGFAAMAGAFAGAHIGVRVSDRFQLVALATALIAAALGMTLAPHQPMRETRRAVSAGIMVVFALIGVLSGLVGVGGGFLFVPALVSLQGLSMREAASLSLMVIAMNAAAALAGYHGKVVIDWRITLIFTTTAVVAALLGGRFADVLPPHLHRRVFAALLAVVGSMVLMRTVV